MKSRVILALLIGSSITLSACGQAAQGTEVAADEGGWLNQLLTMQKVNQQ